MKPFFLSYLFNQKHIHYFLQILIFLFTLLTPMELFLLRCLKISTLKGRGEKLSLTQKINKLKQLGKI